MIKKSSSNNNLYIVINLLLLVVVLWVTFYCFFNTSNSSTGEEKTIFNIIKKEDDKKDEGKTIPINDEMVRNLFLYSHASFVMGCDRNIFGNDKLLVSDMDDEYKSNIASHIFSKDVVNYPYGAEDGITAVIAEKDVKRAYDIIFGPGVYNKPLKIVEGCNNFTYDADNKRYISKGYGCGGTSSFVTVEEIISIKKYSDRLEVVSAVAFTTPDGVFRDYAGREKISDISEEVEVDSNYVLENKDKLMQYTYTYKISESGFYHYFGVERTKD